MQTDRYTKVVLTIIAGCLLLIVGKNMKIMPEARAATAITCNGELKANAWGGIKESIGGYKVQIECN